MHFISPPHVTVITIQQLDSIFSNVLILHTFTSTWIFECAACCLVVLINYTVLRTISKHVRTINSRSVACLADIDGGYPSNLSRKEETVL